MDAFILTYVYADQMNKAHALLAKELGRVNVPPNTYWLASLLDLINGDVSGAKDWLYKAQNHGTEDYLVHKALLKQRSGDTTGAIAALRMDIQRNPLGNHSLWFLAQVAKNTHFEPIARRTLDGYLSLRNSRRSTLDFLAAAYFELGDYDLAYEIANDGKLRDCSTLEEESKINCVAWYDALVHLNLAVNIEMMEKVVQNNPGRADFTDTSPFYIGRMNKLQNL